MNSQEFRALRKRAGLSMAQAARLSGTPYRTWQAWEDEGSGGRRVPGLAVVWLDLYLLESQRQGEM